MSLYIKLVKSNFATDKVTLFLSDSKLIPLSKEQVVRLNLASGQPISPDKLSQLYNYSFFTLLKDYALRLISLTPQSPQLLQTKLTIKAPQIIKKYFLTPSNDTSVMVPRVIKYLKSQNLLNPADFIQSFLHRHQNKSTSFIKYRLKKLGFLKEDIDSTSIGTNQNDVIKKLILKKIKNLSDLKNKNTQNNIKSQLYRRGFTLTEINCVFDDLLSDS